MLILGGLGENWTYPNEILGNDVQGEGQGLYQQNMVVPCHKAYVLVEPTGSHTIGYDKGVQTFFVEVLAPRWPK